MIQIDIVYIFICIYVIIVSKKYTLGGFSSNLSFEVNLFCIFDTAALDLPILWYHQNSIFVRRGEKTTIYKIIQLLPLNSAESNGKFFKMPD